MFNSQAISLQFRILFLSGANSDDIPIYEMCNGSSTQDESFSNDSTTPVISNRGHTMSAAMDREASSGNATELLGNGTIANRWLPPLELPKSAFPSGEGSDRNSLTLQHNPITNCNGSKSIAMKRESSSERDSESKAQSAEQLEGSGGSGPRFSSSHAPPIIVGEWLFSANNKATTSVPQTVSVNNPCIRGIPNYGQTCFLSSVLQSLASLTAFDIYLRSHVQGTHRIRRSSTSLLQQESEGMSSHFLTRLLWQGLQHLNGKTDSSSTGSNWEPRVVLDVVGQSHVQFESSHQQQDAHELLSALLDALVQEQELRRPMKPTRRNRRWFRPRMLPTTPEPEPVNFSYTQPAAVWAITPSFLHLHTTVFAATNENRTDDEEGIGDMGYDFDDDMMSVASSAREGAQQRRQHRVPATITQSNSEHPVGKNESGENDRDNDTKLPLEKDTTTDKPKVVLSPSSMTQARPPRLGGEEKKQEEFEVRIPRINSEEDLSLAGPKANPIHGELDVCEELEEQESDSLSDLSSSGILQSSQASSTNPLKPTQRVRQPQLREATERLAMPFCGWMGSTLQCRTCCYVRPIQNVPFVDISIIPTGVGRPYAMSKTGVGRPCTVEECLSDFTRIERVEQVDCPSCTKQTYIRKVQEELDFWQFALYDATAFQQRKRQQGDATASRSGDLESINEELDRHLELLQQWQLINCDDSDCVEQISHLVAITNNDNERPAKALLRRDASKCLFLTRLPPIFCLHVQRRYYDAQTGRLSKTTQPVLFDEYLNVAPYCAYTTSPHQNGSAAALRKNTPSWAAGATKSFQHPLPVTTPRQIFYRLTAVLEHHGGANCGHYVCYRRSPQGEWWYISDLLVRQVSWQTVQKCQACMLFYENSNIHIRSAT